MDTLLFRGKLFGSDLPDAHDTLTLLFTIDAKQWYPGDHIIAAIICHLLPCCGQCPSDLAESVFGFILLPPFLFPN